MAHAPIAQDKIVDHERPAGLERLPKLAKHLDVALRRLHMRDVAVNSIIVFRRTEIAGVEIAVDGFEAIADAKVSYEFAS